MSKYFYYDKKLKRAIPIKGIYRYYDKLSNNHKPNGYTIIPTDDYIKKSNVLSIHATENDVNAQKCHRAFWKDKIKK